MSLYDQSINKYEYEEKIFYNTVEEAADRVADYLLKKEFINKKL